MNQTLSANVARRLKWVASEYPDAKALVEPMGYHKTGKRGYRWLTFDQLDKESDRISAGLIRMGARRGMRIALLVKPSIDFVSLVFALLKTGVVTILIDPGMGRQNLIACLEAAEPEGFIALPMVQAVRILLRRKFRRATLNVTVGRRWFWGGPTLDQLRATALDGWAIAETKPEEPAAIIFTTGSTGPPKGVLYRHGNFDHQVDQIQSFYGIAPGEVDLPAFPLFGLFNCAMGVTAVIPDMDASRPASIDPAKYVEAATDWNITQSFASPAVWAKVAPYCNERNIQLPTLRRVLSAGAPVPALVLESVRRCIHPDGDVHTPYGATEALPVASIAASEVLAETAARTRQGAGVCVGRRFSEIEWRVVDVVDGPIAAIEQARPLPAGSIGELIVRGPVVTTNYVTRVEANATAKIADGVSFWHRMGDAGYLDEQDRFWFCGRVAHRLTTTHGPMYTIPCEAIFNQHARVARSALVGIGSPGQQLPVIVVEPKTGAMPTTEAQRRTFAAELRELAIQHDLTRSIERVLFHPDFPVDIRHNAKIFREKLAVWAASQIAAAGSVTAS